MLHGKRGSMLALAAVLVTMALMTRRWLLVGAMLLVGVGATVAVPQVRERIAQLPEQLNPNHGGRLTLWTRIAPPLIQEHPLGMGYKATSLGSVSEVQGPEFAPGGGFESSA